MMTECESNKDEGERFKSPEGFKEVFSSNLDCFLRDTDITPSTQLWLIQCPRDHALDLKDGQQISLKLHGDGLLGSFQGPSGKSYDMVSFPSQNSNATVFLPSADGHPKIVGKISRHVSLVHYPEPSELQKQNDEKQKQKSGKSLTSSSHQMAASTQSGKPRSSKSTSTHSSKHKSSLSEAKETPKHKNRKHMEEQTRLTGQSTLDSGRGHTAVTSSGSLQHSSERRSKKIKQHEK